MALSSLNPENDSVVVMLKSIEVIHIDDFLDTRLVLGQHPKQQTFVLTIRQIL